MKALRIASFIIFWLSLSTVCLSDVAVPSGAKDILSHQDYNRINLYRPRSVYLGDAGTHTMLLAAPASLAADTTQFVLPATNGTSGYTLQTDGSGNTSWAVTPIAGGGTGAGTAANARTALGVGTTNSPSFAATLITGTGGAGYVDFAHQSSDAATPGSGSNNVRVIAKSKKLYSVTDNGSGTAVVAELGSGAGGAGELNYIANGSAATDLTGWTVSDAAKLNLARDTTAGELPRNTLTPTGIKLYSVASADSTNAYVYYDFVIDSNDAATSRVLKIQWDQKPLTAAPAATDLVVSIVSSADHTTVLATPVTTAVPVSATQFVTTFVAPATTTASLKISTPNNMADNAGIVLSNVILGPGSVTQGFPGTAWAAASTEVVLKYGTTTATNVSSYTTKVRRVGDSMDFSSNIIFSGAANANGTMNFTIPNGLTIDTAKIPAQYKRVWPVKLYTNNKAFVGFARYVSSTQLSVVRMDDAGVTNGPEWAGDTTAASNIPGGAALANLEYIVMDVSGLPIAEWSSSVYLASGADNNVTPLNWTSYTSTIGGYAGGSPTKSFFYRRVGDSIEIRGKATRVDANYNAKFTFTIPSGLAIDYAKLQSTAYAHVGNAEAEVNAAGNYIGGIFTDNNSTTTLSIYGDSNLGNWSGATNVPTASANLLAIEVRATVPIVGWTAQDYLGKMLTGFATAKVGQSGIVNNDSSNTAGTAILGATDGSVVSAGYVGEEITATQAATNAPTNGQYGDLTSIVLTPGTWDISWFTRLDRNSATMTSPYFLTQAGTVSGNNGGNIGSPLYQDLSTASTFAGVSGSSIPFRKVVASNTTVYLKVLTYYSSGNPQYSGTIRAIRVK